MAMNKFKRDPVHNSEMLVEIIDVTTKSTIKVPLDRIGVTAVTPQLMQMCQNPNYSEHSKTTLTLCELHQKFKCERKETCRHVHVDPEYLRAQRGKHFEWMQFKADAFGRLPPTKTFEVFNATIKEVMEVEKANLEYTRGLFLSPEDRDKRIAGVSSSNAYCGKVPTACLLYLNGTCKWGEHCNQAHINRKWLQTKNREFQRCMEGCKVKFRNLSPNEPINAYHPNLYEVLKIPKRHVIQFTRGLYQGGEKVPSVCLLFQKNRCSCEELCKQIHVAPEWLAKQKKSGTQNRRQRREQTSTGPRHGDAASDAPSASPQNPFPSHLSASAWSPSDSPGCSSMGSYRSVSPLQGEQFTPGSQTPGAAGTGSQTEDAAGVSRVLNMDASPMPEERPRTSKLNVDAKPFVLPQHPPDQRQHAPPFAAAAHSPPSFPMQLPSPAAFVQPGHHHHHGHQHHGHQHHHHHHHHPHNGPHHYSHNHPNHHHHHHHHHNHQAWLQSHAPKQERPNVAYGYMHRPMDDGAPEYLPDSLSAPAPTSGATGHAPGPRSEHTQSYGPLRLDLGPSDSDRPLQPPQISAPPSPPSDEGSHAASSDASPHAPSSKSSLTGDNAVAGKEPARDYAFMPFSPLSLERSQQCIEKSILGESPGFSSFDFGCDLFDEISTTIENVADQEDFLPTCLNLRQNAHRPPSADKTLHPLLPLSSYLDPDIDECADQRILGVLKQMEEIQTRLKSHVEDMDSTLHQLSNTGLSLKHSKDKAVTYTKLHAAIDALSSSALNVHEITQQMHKAVDVEMEHCEAAGPRQAGLSAEVDSALSQA